MSGQLHRRRPEPEEEEDEEEYTDEEYEEVGHSFLTLACILHFDIKYIFYSTYSWCFLRLE